MDKDFKSLTSLINTTPLLVIGGAALAYFVSSNLGEPIEIFNDASSSSETSNGKYSLDGKTNNSSV